MKSPTQRGTDRNLERKNRRGRYALSGTNLHQGTMTEDIKPWKMLTMKCIQNLDPPTFSKQSAKGSSWLYRMGIKLWMKCCRITGIIILSPYHVDINLLTTLWKDFSTFHTEFNRNQNFHWRHRSGDWNSNSWSSRLCRVVCYTGSSCSWQHTNVFSVGCNSRRAAARYLCTTP